MVKGYLLPRLMTSPTRAFQGPSNEEPEAIAQVPLKTNPF